MRKKRIGILSVTEGRGHGAEVVLCELLRGWSSESLELVVIAPERSGVYETARSLNIEVVEFGAGRDALLSNSMAAWRVRRSCGHLDIIHAWTARGFELIPFMRTARQQILTATLHDDPQASFHGGVRRAIMKFAAGRLDALGCVSSAVRDACQSAGYTCRMEVLWNGLNDISPSAESKSPGMNTAHESAVRIIFLGMYTRMKGFHTVLRWIHELGGMEDRIIWNLYGSVCRELEADVRILSEGTYPVVVHGRVEPTKIFPDADILIHASEEFDSLPTVLIEAMRSGIPVVASSLGGSREIVDEGQTGYLFDPANPDEGLSRLKELIGSSSLRQAMGHNARRVFEEKFRISSMVDRYHKFWQQMMDARSD